MTLIQFDKQSLIVGRDDLMIRMLVKFGDGIIITMKNYWLNTWLTIWVDIELKTISKKKFNYES